MMKHLKNLSANMNSGFFAVDIGHFKRVQVT